MNPETQVEHVERLIAAPAEQIFALLDDPRRHRDVDGSGSVREAKTRVDRLVLGSRFGMRMRIKLPYSMVNTVIEYEKNRLIAWQTRAPGIVGTFIGGRIWRYTLTPTDTGTLVRESWDTSQEGLLTRRATRRIAGLTRRNMAATLRRIDELLTTGTSTAT
jgi:uncharacterized protein YndB with AHSA1/START domain